MSEDLREEEAGDGAEEAVAAAEPKKPLPKKRLLAIGAAALSLAAAAGGGFYLFGQSGAEEPAPGPTAYVEVPAMTVNLRAAGGESRFLKLRFVLLAEAGAEEAVRQKIPVIVDAYQPFVRELRPEDLSGSAAVFRLKEELLVRTTEAAGAGAVRDILIQDLVQQ